LTRDSRSTSGKERRHKRSDSKSDKERDNSYKKLEKEPAEEKESASKEKRRTHRRSNSKSERASPKEEKVLNKKLSERESSHKEGTLPSRDGSPTPGRHRKKSDSSRNKTSEKDSDRVPKKVDQRHLTISSPDLKKQRRSDPKQTETEKSSDGDSRKVQQDGKKKALNNRKSSLGKIIPPMTTPKTLTLPKFDTHVKTVKQNRRKSEPSVIKSPKISDEKKRHKNSPTASSFSSKQSKGEE